MPEEQGRENTVYQNTAETKKTKGKRQRYRKKKETTTRKDIKEKNQPSLKEARVV